MKNKLIALMLLLGLAVSVSSQTTYERPGKYQTGITLFNDFWQYSGNDMKPRTINQGIDAYFLLNIPVEKSPLTFSLGTGIGSHNLFSNALLILDTNNNYVFRKISEMDTNGVDYKKNKLSVTYWDFPAEFRYRHKSGFTIGVGMKFGFVLSSHTKYKGDDYIFGTENQIKLKVKDVRNMEKWRYGFTARIGYKAFEAYGFYSLTKVFREGEGPEIFPVSIGISVRPAFLEGGK